MSMPVLKKFGRYFYSERYVYCIHLHTICPWSVHERPVKILWERGSKHQNNGATSALLPVHSLEKHTNYATLEIEESLHVQATLYAGDFRSKRTGPYAVKQLTLVVVEDDCDGSDDKSVDCSTESEGRRILGTLTVNLNEYVGVRDRRFKMPLDCSKGILKLVGKPVLELTINCLHSHTSDAALAELGPESQLSRPVEKHASLPESSSLKRMKSSFWNATKSLGRNSFKSLFVSRKES